MMVVDKGLSPEGIFLSKNWFYVPNNIERGVYVSLCGKEILVDPW